LGVFTFLRKKVNTQIFTFELKVFYLFTNRIITHFGSKLLKKLCDFADLVVGRT